MNELWERRDHRVRYQATVRLLPPGQQRTILAEASNLSASGVFVQAPELCDVGTELLCDLPLPDDHLTVRGRVAWVKPWRGAEQVPGAGMGIQFIDLSDGDERLLRRLVGPMREENQSVKVWFEGMSQPVRAQAVRTGDGIRLRTVLPFLRLDSAVRVAFGEGDSAVEAEQFGVLHGVALEARAPHDVPRLQVDLSLPLRTAPHSDAESVSEDEDADLAEWQSERTPTMQFQVAREPIAPVVAEPAPVTDEPMLLVTHKSSSNPGGAAAGSIELKACVDLPAVETSSVEVAEVEDASDTLVSQRRSALAEEVSARPVGPPPLSEPVIPIYEDPPLSAAEYGRYGEFWEETEAPRRRSRRAWLWAAAVVMAGIAVASLVQTKPWETVADRLEQGQGETLSAVDVDPLRSTASGAAPTIVRVPAKEDPQPAAQPAPKAVEAPVAAAAAAEASAEDRPDDAPEEPAAPSVVAPKEVASKTTAGKTLQPKASPAAKTDKHAKTVKAAKAVKAVAPASRHPVVTVDGGRAVVTIPVKGSLEGAKHYRLASPEGVAINLPQGEAGVPVGNYALQKGGYRLVWVRKRPEGGAHLRVFFAGTKGECEVKLEKGLVRVILAPTAK